MKGTVTEERYSTEHFREAIQDFRKRVHAINLMSKARGLTESERIKTEKKASSEANTSVKTKEGKEAVR